MTLAYYKFIMCKCSITNTHGHVLNYSTIHQHVFDFFFRQQIWHTCVTESVTASRIDRLIEKWAVVITSYHYHLAVRGRWDPLHILLPVLVAGMEFFWSELFRDVTMIRKLGPSSRLESWSVVGLGRKMFILVLWPEIEKKHRKWKLLPGTDNMF